MYTSGIWNGPVMECSSSQYHSSVA